MLGQERTDWFAAGSYDRSTQTFTVEKVPTPPQAMREVHRRPSEYGGVESLVDWSLVVACPACCADVHLVWRETVTDEYIDHMESAVSRAGHDRWKAERRAADAERALKHAKSKATKVQHGNKKKRRGW